MVRCTVWTAGTAGTAGPLLCRCGWSALDWMVDEWIVDGAEWLDGAENGRKDYARRGCILRVWLLVWAACLYGANCGLEGADERD